MENNEVEFVCSEAKFKGRMVSWQIDRDGRMVIEFQDASIAPIHTEPHIYRAPTPTVHSAYMAVKAAGLKHHRPPRMINICLCECSTCVSPTGQCICDKCEVPHA